MSASCDNGAERCKAVQLCEGRRSDQPDASSWTYLDTAYVLKCYIQEPGSEQVRAFARDCERLACSVYGRLELYAALHRKLREGRLDEQGLDVVLWQLRVDDSVGLRE